MYAVQNALYIVHCTMYNIHCTLSTFMPTAFTAFCALAEPWEGFIIGAVGGGVSLVGISLLERLQIDDPVG